MTTHTIFPTVIAKSYDSQFELVKDDLIAWMTNYAKTYPTNSRSNVDGYQSLIIFGRWMPSHHFLII